MKSRISVVFVSTNEGEVLIPAIESLLASDDNSAFDVVIVDNASDDGAAAEIAKRWPEVEVMRNDVNLGLPANLNIGIRASDSNYVMLCNSDLVFGPAAVTTLASFLDSHPNAAMAAPKLLSPEGEVRPSARRWYSPAALLALKGPWSRWFANSATVRNSIYADWDYAGPRPVDWVPCPATMVRRKAFEEVGLMDERFRLYFDDVDISLRMHATGWEVWCVPGAEVVHIEQRASVRPFSRPWRWHMASLAKFALKHKGLKPRKP